MASLAVEPLATVIAGRAVSDAVGLDEIGASGSGAVVNHIGVGAAISLLVAEGGLSATSQLAPFMVI